MTGHRIRLPAGIKLKDGKISNVTVIRMSVSKRIAQRKSKKVRVAKKAP